MAVACYRAGGTDCSSKSMEAAIIFITTTIVWPQVNNREETQPHTSIENWIKDVLNMVEVRVRDQECQAVTAQEQPRSYPHPRQGAASGRSCPISKARGGGREEQPMSKEQWLHGRQRAYRSYSTFKVGRGGGEEISLAQGKEQWLRFAGAAGKRYPTSKVRETQVRRWVLQEGIRGQTH